MILIINGYGIFNIERYGLFIAYEKSEANNRKHHVSFDLAINVFADPNRVEFYDQKHSVDEERFITIGYVENVPLFVVYSMVGDDYYRIISA